MSDQKPAAPPAPPAVPEYLKQFMQPVASATGPSEADALVSVSVSIPRISLKAKKFRFIVDGEEVKASPDIHGVILGVEPGPGRFVKAYYEGQYNPGDTSPPTCASSDGVRPDPWVTSPQNDLCSSCKWNAFGSATSRTGKRAKACRDAKRIWVTEPDKIADTVFAMNVPVTSLNNLSELGKVIKESGLPLSAAVIHFTMEEDESFPIIKFAVVGWLHEQPGLLAMERNKAKNWDGALKVDNPPVLMNRPAEPPPKVNDDGSIQGTATRVEPPKAQPNVDEALKNWG